MHSHSRRCVQTLTSLRLHFVSPLAHARVCRCAMEGLGPGTESPTADDSPEESDADSPPQLSAHALAALQEFYAEEAMLQEQLALGEKETPKLIAEDWVNP